MDNGIMTDFIRLKAYALIKKHNKETAKAEV